MKYVASLLAFALSAPPLRSQGVVQTQVFDGSASFRRLGSALALSPDGNLAVAVESSPQTLRVYRRFQNGGWTLEATLSPSFISILYPNVDTDGVRIIAEDWVYASTGGTWHLEQVLGEQAWAAAIDGDICVVGANQDVAVYYRTSGGWVREDVFHLPACCLWSVDVEGNRVVAGLPGGSIVSRVEVFERSGSFPFASWAKTATILSPAPQLNDRFGETISLQGPRLVVGAAGTDLNGSDNGVVYEFLLSTDTWSLGRTLVTPATLDGTLFGEYVSLDYPYVAIGSSPAGVAHLYELVGDDHFAEVWRRTEGGLHGSVLKLADDVVLTSVPEASFSAPNSGRIYLHRIDEGTGGTLRLATYCTGKANSAGCVPFITAQGVSSPTDTAASFVVNAEDAIPGEPGFLFYGSAGKLNLSFHGGTLCVKTPLTRLFPPKAAQPGGPGACGGRLDRGLNKRIQSGVDPRLTVGQRVYAQWYLRDPNDPLGFGDSLTDALTFVICD